MRRSARTVYGWEKGEAVPSALQLAALADLYGCHPGDFFSEGDK
jgi:transcriptional regulator with XRE-family HTH domain